MSPKSRFGLMIAGLSFIFVLGIVAIVSVFLLQKTMKIEVHTPKSPKLNVKDVKFFK